MSNLITAQRVTIIADDMLEDIITGQLGKLGAKGYTIMECRGCGEHQVVQDLGTISSRLRIETIVQPPVAEAIMHFLDSSQFSGRAVTACVDEVRVSPTDTF